MGEIRCEKVVVTTTGSDGAATGNTSSAAINGLIESLYLDYHADAPSTTVVTTTFAIRGGTIHAASASKTDKLFTPRAKPIDNADGAITNAHTCFACNQAVTVTVTLSNALTAAVTAYIYYRTP